MATASNLKIGMRVQMMNERSNGGNLRHTHNAPPNVKLEPARFDDIQGDRNYWSMTMFQLSLLVVSHNVQ